MTDRQILEFMYERLVEVHGENPLTGYMARFRGAIDNLTNPSRLQEAFAGLVKHGVWMLGLSESDIALSALLERKLSQEGIDYRTTSQNGNDISFFLD